MRGAKRSSNTALARSSAPLVTMTSCAAGKRGPTEINLTVLAYNLKRVCNLVGVQNLIAAVV